ncbi:MAG: DinB family protein [Planctomycetes bacterium]|nr:DinB family protein [Planctomycetota bacterium]
MEDFVQSIIEECVHEGKMTMHMLELLPQDQLGWRPHAKSFSLGQLALHIAVAPAGISQWLQSDAIHLKDISLQVPEGKSKERIIEKFHESQSLLEKNLRALSEEQLDQQWSFHMNDDQSYNAPRREIIRSLICNHLYHHRGQLTVYLRMLDIELPEVYGPTADTID